MKRLQRSAFYVDKAGVIARFPQLSTLSDDEINELIIRAEQTVDCVVGQQNTAVTGQQTQFPREKDVITMTSLDTGGVDTEVLHAEYVEFTEDGTWNSIAATTGQFGLNLFYNYFVQDEEPTEETVLPAEVIEATYLVIDMIQPSSMPNIPAGLSIRIGAATVKNNALVDDEPSSIARQLSSTDEGRQILSLLKKFKIFSYRIA